MKPQLYKGFVIRQVRTHILTAAGMGMHHFPLSRFQYSNTKTKQRGERPSLKSCRKAVDELLGEVPA